MKVRPILFSAPMVRALLAGTKTQTRRVCKLPLNDRGTYIHIGTAEKPYGTICGQDQLWRHCPHGKPGDRLWVRETGWERPERSARDMREGADTWPPYAYDADGIDEAEAEQYRAWRWKRRPSIFMPRWASRITLDLLAVRVERLNSIGQGDACAEGAPPPHEPIGWYEGLWESINGKGSWGANPWVWVVEFKRI